MCLGFCFLTPKSILFDIIFEIPKTAKRQRGDGYLSISKSEATPKEYDYVDCEAYQTHISESIASLKSEYTD